VLSWEGSLFCDDIGFVGYGMMCDMEFLFLIYFDSFRFSEYMEYRKKVNNAVIPSISLIAIASILSSIAVGCCAFLELDVTYFNTSGKIS